MIARLRRWLKWRSGPAISASLWGETLQHYPFLRELPGAEQNRLLALVREFLRQKQFSGAHGLIVTDAMALCIAAQACRPLLHMGQTDNPRHLLRWYDDFVGIVLHPDQMIVTREVQDDSGVVHRYRELIAGEAMDQGPVTLNWHDVVSASGRGDSNYNLVIHEFAHKLDLRDGVANGCPPLPRGFLGSTSAAQARKLWLAALQPAFDQFREQVIKAERFGTEPPWMDAYCAESLSEFFAVACEAYFVQQQRFARELPGVKRVFDAFFKR